MGDRHQDRRGRLAALLAGVPAGPVDAALITGVANVRYLTGLASTNAVLLVRAAGTAVLATDARYAGTAAEVCPDLPCVVERATAQALTALAAESGVRRLGFEAHHVSVERHAELAAMGKGGARPAAPSQVELVPLGRPVEELRTVKDEAEISLLREACAITDRAFAAVLPLIGPGVTEREIAVALERHMVDLGAEGPAFDSIVASGPHGAIPHHRPGGRAIARGDLVTMDFGARYGGYHADMTRTVAVGAAAGWQRTIYALVKDAQRAGIDAARPDAGVQEVDGAARAVIEAAGHGDDFPHGLGHGVGLEIHEAPMLGYGKTGKLGDRVPITAEPGVYLKGRGGVRIEDTLVVRPNGPEILTKTTKDLLVL